MLRPLGNRVVLQMNKVYLKDAKKKPMLDEYGNHSFKSEEYGTVLSSNVDGIKKGSKIYPIIRGGVPLNHLETKNHQVIVIDFEDCYAQEV